MRGTRNDANGGVGRRQFAKALAGGVGVAWLGRSLPLFGQTPAAPPVLAATDWERVGVTLSEVKLGMSAAFKGTIAGLGVDYYRGAAALLAEVNAQGGVAGRQVKVIARDDGYDPPATLRNSIQLIEEQKVFALFNYVGTPTLSRALPVIRQQRDRGLVLVGNLTGAQPQREDPYGDQVFNIRASYRREMASTVEEFWKLGFRKFGVFYQIDSYGRSGVDGVTRALSARGADIVSEATYRRGAVFSEKMTAAVDHLKKAGVDAILCTGAYEAAAAFVRDAREAGWKVPITNISFVGSDSMLALLVEEGKKVGKDLTKGLVNSQIVPSYDDVSLPTVKEYRDLMDKWKPAVPAELVDSSFIPPRYSFNSLEGFLNAKVVVEALRRAGPELTRARFRAALESIVEWDPGIGAAVTFSRTRHQGLDRVYFTTVSSGRWVGVADWRQAVTA